MKIVMVTGASGFIGRQLCKILANQFKVIAIDRNPMPDIRPGRYERIIGDITDVNFLKTLFSKHSPDVLIHCAAISTESLFNSIQFDQYDKTNAVATQMICKEAATVNPDLFFIFFSSISVYGEKLTNRQIKETDNLYPTSKYSKSKRDAEKWLKELYRTDRVKNLDILRLAPVYASDRLSSIEKRVMDPIKSFFIKFGTGEQKVSMLSIHNLIEFLIFRIDNMPHEPSCSVFNVCDEENYSFNKIVRLLRSSDAYPNSMIIKVPLLFIWIATRLAGTILSKQGKWIRSWYDKLAKDFIFDNQKMLSTGFLPKHNLDSVFKLKIQSCKLAYLDSCKLENSNCNSEQMFIADSSFGSGQKEHFEQYKIRN